MKSFAIYFLISVIGFQPVSIGVVNLLNLSDLVEHYQLHQNEYHNSFTEFIELHYGSQKESHADQHKDHENLPFQESQYNTSNFYFESSESINLGSTKPIEKIHHNFNYKIDFTFLSETDILYPPKY